MLSLQPRTTPGLVSHQSTTASHQESTTVANSGFAVLDQSTQANMGEATMVHQYAQADLAPPVQLATNVEERVNLDVNIEPVQMADQGVQVRACILCSAACCPLHV